MRVEQVLERLGGVASASELRRHASWAKIRVALRRGCIIRDRHGRYALPSTSHAVRVTGALSGVLCLDSAAQYHGWKLKHPPKIPAVAVRRKRNLAAERREGVRLMYVDLTPDEITGMATSYVRTVMDCTARLPFDEALAIADSALRCRHVTKVELILAAEAMPDRYRAQCLRVAWHADGRAAESFEFHGKRKALYEDCERYNAFAMKGWWVIRFAWEHVMFEPEYVREVLSRMVQMLSAQPPFIPLSRRKAA